MNGCAREMPKYRGHREVHALKIAELLPDVFPGSMLMVPAEDGCATIELSRYFVNKHNPKVGGYYVVYADGYKSYLPAKAFESGYTRIQ